MRRAGSTKSSERALSKCLALLVLTIPLSAAGLDSTWDRKAAAHYLDQRASWWMGWPTAARDHGTFCVSCHTALPFALARPSLRRSLAEETPSADERKFLQNVAKRVQMWNEVEPFYKGDDPADPKSAESRGTEAILNAVILASYDAQGGGMSKETELAFHNMWS